MLLQPGNRIISVNVAQCIIVSVLCVWVRANRLNTPSLSLPKLRNTNHLSIASYRQLGEKRQALDTATYCGSVAVNGDSEILLCEMQIDSNATFHYD